MALIYEIKLKILLSSKIFIKASIKVLPCLTFVHIEIVDKCLCFSRLILILYVFLLFSILVKFISELVSPIFKSSLFIFLDIIGKVWLFFPWLIIFRIYVARFRKRMKRFNGTWSWPLSSSFQNVLFFLLTIIISIDIINFLSTTSLIFIFFPTIIISLTKIRYILILSSWFLITLIIFWITVFTLFTASI